MSAALALQGAVVAALKADAAIAELVGARIYDAVPAEAAFPYLVVDGWDALPDPADAYDGVDIAFVVHAWSRAVGFPETHRLAAAVEGALFEDALSPALAAAGLRLVEIRVERTHALRDPDGHTRHGVVSFEAMLEPI
ncbi:DUF3168 domain-containing protein [Blastochloris tepida]|uniref:DUF3168 domain-containing protein n=1 Tax=Blastochloris tepida TaxID=2233851 RepID=A0A348G1E6_9HYPH|nr:DUF3168 domain-containing protein [Blastochloris tepida]BBF93379.1 hypothetical protein BLTE_20640 [Blastochloris tepida]